MFLKDKMGNHHELRPLCVLDFYIHESAQRAGHGYRLFEHMLQVLYRARSVAILTSTQAEVTMAKLLAYDRPSNKLLPFLARHYKLREFLPQPNNFVVFLDHPVFAESLQVLEQAKQSGVQRKKAIRPRANFQVENHRPNEDIDLDQYSLPPTVPRIRDDDEDEERETLGRSAPSRKQNLYQTIVQDAVLKVSTPLADNSIPSPSNNAVALNSPRTLQEKHQNYLKRLDQCETDHTNFFPSVRDQDQEEIMFRFDKNRKVTKYPTPDARTLVQGAVALPKEEMAERKEVTPVKEFKLFDVDQVVDSIKRKVNPTSEYHRMYGTIMTSSQFYRNMNKGEIALRQDVSTAIPNAPSALVNTSSSSEIQGSLASRKMFPHRRR